MAKQIVAGSDCKDCKHFLSEGYVGVKNKIYCKARDKVYFYGQYVNCEDKEKRDGNETFN